MDVLANYTTYKSYFGLIKRLRDDPQVPQREAAKALARFLRMHPVNIRQKVEVIVEHFRSFTRAQDRRAAKAMVVTDSSSERRALSWLSTSRRLSAATRIFARSWRFPAKCSIRTFREEVSPKPA